MTDERLVAEQLVPIESSNALTVRISQHTGEEFFRVDFTRHGTSVDHLSTTVAPGDNFMMNLIADAMSGEAVAWRHLAHWGRDNLGRPGVSLRFA